MPSSTSRALPTTSDVDPDSRRRTSARSSRLASLRHRLQKVLRTPTHALVLLTIIYLCISPALAVFVPFENCLQDNYIASNVPEGDTVQLQFYPLYVDAVFDSLSLSHTLKVTVWGNVTGQVGTDALPAWNDPEWSDPGKVPEGKIHNQPAANAGEPSYLTTLYEKVNVANYQPYENRSTFCGELMNSTCPLGPVFDSTPEAEPYNLPSFELANDFSSKYAFSTFTPTFIIWNGDAAGTPIGCISATVTPSLGVNVAGALRFAPLAILLFVGLATAFAAILSPWGSSNVFHWTTNYGRDPDLLRLVTPGFGDCLQYIQFIVLTAGLNLEYPGYFQPAVSQASWSVLLFNESFVSHEPPFQSLVDGVYVTNGTYGIENVARIVGLGDADDIWAGVIIWLLVIIAIVLVVIQAGFLGRWALRTLSNTPEEDLRAKNMPLSAGNVIRLVFSYFFLPLVSFSTFQLVIAGGSEGILTAMAVITLALIIGFAGWLMYIIVTTKPRSLLFDDLGTVLLYGPLYNTYSDEAAPFALIPIFLTFMRGIAIGAVQPSGVAQVAILAICEVIQSLTLHAFRPFHSPTSMNIYHTGFSVLRFITVILMVTFVPSMGVTEGPKAWIGYVILGLHGAVLVFGFFLNALQTIIEVIARLSGAGGDDVRGQTRGGLSKIFGARQLQRRTDRGGPSRQSQLSTAMMLDAENASKRGYGRVRSESAGSMGILLNPQLRSSSALDARSVDAYSGPLTATAMTPATANESGSFSVLPSPGQATRPGGAADPYYRPPRARRPTLDEAGSPLNPVATSGGSVDLSTRRMSSAGGALLDIEADNAAAAAAAAAGGRSTPAPQSYAPVFAPRADYSTRESDFYYGVRGPALNRDSPGRRLGTGPADPTSPMSTATGWIRGLFTGKTKDKGKGFEVVRSARMPPAMKARGGEFSDDAPPEGIPVAMGVLRNGPIDSDDEDDAPGSNKKSSGANKEPAAAQLLDSRGERGSNDEDDVAGGRVSKEPPLLPDLDAGETFSMPTRAASKTSRQASQRTTGTRISRRDTVESEKPEVPRKSSKRNSSVDQLKRLSTNLEVQSERSRSRSGSRMTPEGKRSQTHLEATARLPFDRTNSQRRLSSSSMGATDDMSNPVPSADLIDNGGEDDENRPTSYGFVHQHNISRVDPDEPVDLLGSSAELVDDRRRASRSSSTSERS